MSGAAALVDATLDRLASREDLLNVLKKLGVIDPLSVLELTKPPKLDLLKQRQKKMEQARKEQQDKMLAAGVQPGKGGKLKAA